MPTTSRPAHSSFTLTRRAAGTGFLRFGALAAKVMESEPPHPSETLSMKHLAALALFALAVPAVHAGGSLKEARQLLLRGNYAEARQMYADLVKDGKDGAPAVVGLSKAHQSEGDYDKALRSVEIGLKELPKNPALLARRAEALYLLGRWDDATQAAQAAIDANDKSYVARWVQGQVQRDRGERDKADESFRWFIKAFNENDIDDLDDLLCVGLAVLERARLHHLDDQYQFVIDEIFNGAAKKDKDYWPALYEKGKLFLEKHNKQDAYTAFEKALTINPQAAEVLVGKGEMAAQGFEMRDAEDRAEEALAINPSLVTALRLRADVYAFSGETDKAIKDLTKARGINPRGGDAGPRGRRAAVAKKGGRLQGAGQGGRPAQSPAVHLLHRAGRAARFAQGVSRRRRIFQDRRQAAAETRRGAGGARPALHAHGPRGRGRQDSGAGP